MSPVDSSAAAGRPQRSPLATGLVLLGLWGLAVAQPLLDLLGRTTAFFVAHRAEPSDLWLFAGLVTFGVPLALAALLWLLRFVSARLSRGAEFVITALLTALIVASWSTNWPLQPLWVCGIAAIAGAVVAAMILRSRHASRFAQWLGLAAVVFPALFLLVSPVRKMIFPVSSETVGDAETKKTARRRARKKAREARAALEIPHQDLEPITAVLVVFDELPLISLMNPEEAIDAQRFPHFADLADTSTWYRNATTVSHSTAYAVPAILSGRYPPPRQVSQPLHRDYQTNLFTLLGGGANLNVVETLTELCPRSLCRGRAHLIPRVLRLSGQIEDASAVYLHLVTPRGWAHRLPEIGETWRDFWGPPPADAGDRRHKAWGQDPGPIFDGFLESMEAFPAPTLHYLHIMAPHLPWDRLPDGSRYRTVAHMPHGLVRQSWRGTDFELLQAQQRHLLQLGWTDQLVGRLRQELESLGRWDNAIVVITSDHGTAFGSSGLRRNLTSANFAEIANVPLFVKYPGQRVGSIDDGNAETIDIVPTLLAAFESEMDATLDGKNLADEARRPSKTIFRSGLRGSPSGRGEEYGIERLEQRRDFLRRNERRLGSGDWDGLWRIGPHPELIGEAVDSLPGTEKRPGRPFVHLDEPDQYLSVDLSGDVLPVHITGRLELAEGSPSIRLAVAVNGTIQGITESFDAERHRRFSCMVSPLALREGDNAIELLAVDDSGRLLRFRRLRNRGPEEPASQPDDAT